MSTSAQRYPLAKATRWADQIVDRLAPLVTRIDIAGSIRRGAPDIGDIDLVCMVDHAQRQAARARIMLNAAVIHGDGLAGLRIELDTGLHIDVTWSDLPTEDLFRPTPTNHGTRLLTRTGSMAFNRWLAQRAIEAGAHWHPYAGLKTAGARAQVISGPTPEVIAQHDGDLADIPADAYERPILAALRLPWIPPEDRSTPDAWQRHIP